MAAPRTTPSPTPIPAPSAICPCGLLAALARGRAPPQCHLWLPRREKSRTRRRHDCHGDEIASPGFMPFAAVCSVLLMRRTTSMKYRSSSRVSRWRREGVLPRPRSQGSDRSNRGAAREHGRRTARCGQPGESRPISIPVTYRDRIVSTSRCKSVGLPRFKASAKRNADANPVLSYAVARTYGTLSVFR